MTSSLDSHRFDELLKLAHAAPDESLVDRLFAEVAGLPHEEPALTPQERNWVLLNLNENPIWDGLWQARVQQHGRLVSLPSMQQTTKSSVPESSRAQATIQWLAPLRYAVAATVLLGAVYGGLWGIGQATMPASYGLAAIDSDAPAFASAVRGESEASAFEQGTVSLLAAPTSTLGLFPRYDQDAATRAASSFERAYAEAAGPFDRAEAAFFAGKAYLMQDDRTEASRWLQLVLDQNVADYRDEAAALLAELNTMAN
ncbi:MAG: hypothetical protein AAGI08_05965 [Bacteroidota bacterium]